MQATPHELSRCYLYIYSDIHLYVTIIKRGHKFEKQRDKDGARLKCRIVIAATSD